MHVMNETYERYCERNVHQDVVAVRRDEQDTWQTPKRDSHRNVDQLDEVPNESHNSESDSDSLGNLNKFCKGCQLCVRKLCLSERTFVGRLGTPGKELKTKVRRCESRRLDSACLVTLTDELLGNVDELLELVGHGGGRNERRYWGLLERGRERNAAGGTRLQSASTCLSSITRPSVVHKRSSTLQ